MRRTRFSIAGLMGFVLIAALGFGGLKNSSPVWASACYSLTLLALIVAVLFAIQSRGQRRTLCVGFSVVGSVYFAFAFLFPFTPEYMSPPQLLTTALLKSAESLFFPETSNNAFVTYSVSSSVPTLVAPVPPPPPTLAITAAVPPPVVPSDTTESVPPQEGVIGVPVAAEAMQPPEQTPIAAAPPVVISNTATTSSSATLNGVLLTGPNNLTGFPAVNYNLGLSTVYGTLNNVPSPVSFHQIGQSLITLVVAYLGGIFSVFLAARRGRDEANHSPEVSPSSP